LGLRVEVFVAEVQRKAPLAAFGLRLDGVSPQHDVQHPQRVLARVDQFNELPQHGELRIDLIDKRRGHDMIGRL
jgi:hypothetical protein